MLHRSSTFLVSFLFIVLVFVGCFGLTATLVTPIQSLFLPEITTYASLVFLPHGAAILSTMYFGWKAILPLFVAHWVSGYLFGPSEVPYLPDLWGLASQLIAAACPFISFEAFRRFGKNYYYTADDQTTHWKAILLVGILASILNAIGQVFFHSDHLDAAAYARVSIVYAFGDAIGLVVSMLVLMLIFRWVRIGQKVFGK